MSFHHIQNKTYNQPVIKFYDQTINYSTNTKFLGVWLEDNLKWTVHIQYLAQKLSRLCFAIQITRRVLGLESLRNLYFAYFHSVITYGIILWGNSPQARLIFKLQKRVIRTIMRVRKQTSCRELFKKLHILPLPCIYILETLVHVKKIWTNIK